ncbi:hypothetical protein BC827DRAFT_1268418 [Russula dissimulans]|nr:hypothetical protein BC827DRAFT_1268418 [Russula dissimulans]
MATSHPRLHLSRWKSIYVRKQYFTRHLDWAVRSEFERTDTRCAIQTRTQPIQQSTGYAADDRSVHNASPSHRVIRHIDTQTLPIPSAGLEVNLSTRLSRYGTVQAINPEHQDDHFGGFGDLLSWHHSFPYLKRDLHRTLTTPLSPVLFVLDQGEVLPVARPVPYLRFRARVGHNSCFIGLSDGDYDGLGDIEYRALTVLLWIVSVYHIFTLLIPFAVLAPYMSTSKWKENFLPPNQKHRVISPIWYTAFQVVGGWANTGFSLVDQNLCPSNLKHRTLYLYSWSDWRSLEILAFFTDWFFFLPLNIGISVFEAVPVGQRFLLGLPGHRRFGARPSNAAGATNTASHHRSVELRDDVQKALPDRDEVRAAASLSPRRIFVDENDDIKNEADYPTTYPRVAIWGHCLGRHTRRQLSFEKLHALRRNEHVLKASYLHRHAARQARGLPVALDRVVVFPTVFMHKTSEKVRKMKTDRRVEGASALRIGSGRGEKLRSVNEDAIS